MRIRDLLFAGCILLGSLLSPGIYAQQSASGITVEQLPAIYKSGKGPAQKVKVQIEHTGQPVQASLQLGDQTKKERLVNGTNVIEFDIPAVSSSASMELTVTKGKDKASIPVTVTPVRKWEMNFVQHTHTDIGYTRSQTEILAENLRYIDYALDYCDATDNYPEDAKFRWTCETAWAVSEYLKSRPAEQIERLKKRVAEGRIELAAMYLNFDELPDEQTLAASLYPLKEFRKHGLKAEMAMQNDVNGIGWCFTEYFADAGVKYVNMGTHGHRALICFDYPTVFWWESPSGKKVLTYRAEHYHYGNFFGIHSDDFTGFEAKVLKYLNDLGQTDYPYDITAIQHSGYHTDNSPPSTNSCDFVKRWNEKYDWPKLRTAIAEDFLKEVENNYTDKIQTIRGAWPDWWTDGFGSGAREAAISRITHSDIIATQAGLSFAKMLGSTLPTDIDNRIDDVNKALLFYDEHTFGFSESVRDAYGKDTWEQRSLKQSYAWEAYRRSGIVGEIAMGLLQAYIPKAELPSIVVFNTLNWTYSGIAKAYIDYQLIPRNKEFEIIDAQGQVIPAQAGNSRSDGTYWSLYVKDVPAFGYAQYYIRVKDEPRKPVVSSDKLENVTVENQWYKIEFSPRKGTVSQILDKELNKEILTKGADWEFGAFVYEIIDSRRPMELYTYPQFIRRAPEKIRFEKYEKGAIWDTYLFKGETVAGREPDNLSVEFRVFNLEKKIELVYSLRKKAITDPEAIYISFPYEVENGKLYLDVPGGTIEAGVDQVPGSSNDWYTVQNFATARNKDWQVVMGSQEIPLMQMGAINTGRYEAGATPQSTNMYSWPMNNYWVTNFNADQMGQFEWSYFINSSADNSIGYATRFAWENRIPFLTRVLPEGQKGAQVITPASLFEIIPDNLLVVNMRPVEGENAVMLQIREINGQPAKFEVKSNKINFTNTVVCDVVGTPVPGNSSANFAPWENKFIKLVIGK